MVHCVLPRPVIWFLFQFFNLRRLSDLLVRLVQILKGIVWLSITFFLLMLVGSRSIYNKFNLHLLRTRLKLVVAWDWYLKVGYLIFGITWRYPLSRTVNTHFLIFIMFIVSLFFVKIISIFLIVFCCLRLLDLLLIFTFFNLWNNTGWLLYYW